LPRFVRVSLDLHCNLWHLILMQPCAPTLSEQQSAHKPKARVKLRRKPMIDNENNAVHRMYLPYRTIFRLSRTGKDASFHKLRRCSGVSELCTNKIRPFRRYICSKGQSEVKCCQHGILRRAEARRFTPCANSGLHSRNRPARPKKTPSSDPYASWQHSVMRLREGVGVT